MIRGVVRAGNCTGGQLWSGNIFGESGRWKFLTESVDSAVANGLNLMGLNLNPHLLRAEGGHPKAVGAGGVIKSGA